MSFYIYAFSLALFQTFVLLPLFSGYIYTPDFVTVALLYRLLTSQNGNLKPILIPAIFLDLLHDSLGLNMSSKLLVSFTTDKFKQMYLITSKGALVIFSISIFLMEHLFKYVLFRVKYYYPFEPLNLIVCLFVETLAIFALSKRIILKNA